MWALSDLGLCHGEHLVAKIDAYARGFFAK
jgi:hypothetical protein